MWIVLIGDEFKPEFKELPEQVQDEIASLTDLLEITGPLLGRPRADTLKGSKHANMKELASMHRMEFGEWHLLSI